MFYVSLVGGCFELLIHFHENQHANMQTTTKANTKTNDSLFVVDKVVWFVFEPRSIHIKLEYKWIKRITKWALPSGL